MIRPPPWRDDLRVVRLSQAAPAPSIRQGRVCSRKSTALTEQRPPCRPTHAGRACLHPSDRPRCALESTALTTKPPGGGEEAHRQMARRASGVRAGCEQGKAAPSKQRPPGGTTSVSSDSRGEAAPIPPSAFLNSPHFVDYVKTSGKAAKADNYPLTDLGAFRIMRVLWISSDRYLLLPQSGIVSILAERRSARWAWNLPLRLFLTDLATPFLSSSNFHMPIFLALTKNPIR